MTDVLAIFAGGAGAIRAAGAGASIEAAAEGGGGGGGTGGLPPTGRIDPWKVNFTQEWVSWNMNGTDPVTNLPYNIGDTAWQLRTGELADIPGEPVRLFWRDGELFTLDNRRPMAYRSAGKTMPYQIVGPEAITSPGLRKRYNAPAGLRPWIRFNPGGWPF